MDKFEDIDINSNTKINKKKSTRPSINKLDEALTDIENPKMISNTQTSIILK